MSCNLQNTKGGNSPSKTMVRKNFSSIFQLGTRCMQPGFEKWASKTCHRACSNKQFIRQHVKNKTTFFNKWPSGRLDAHLAKSLAPNISIT